MATLRIVTLGDIGKVLRRRLRKIVSCALVLAAGLVLFYRFQAPEFTYRALVLTGKLGELTISPATGEKEVVTRLASTFPELREFLVLQFSKSAVGPDGAYLNSVKRPADSEDVIEVEIQAKNSSQAENFLQTQILKGLNRQYGPRIEAKKQSHSLNLKIFSSTVSNRQGDIEALRSRLLAETNPSTLFILKILRSDLQRDTLDLERKRELYLQALENCREFTLESALVNVVSSVFPPPTGRLIFIGLLLGTALGALLSLMLDWRRLLDSLKVEAPQPG